MKTESWIVSPAHNYTKLMKGEVKHKAFRNIWTGSEQSDHNILLEEKRGPGTVPLHHTVLY